MANNIKLKVNAGLQNTWGVFSLKGDTSTGTGDAYDAIKIKVMVDGDKKVTNSEYTIMHAGESNYKDSEAINPIFKDSSGNYGWELNLYGPDFKSIIRRYFKNDVTTYVADLDIYDNADAYNRYINQFRVTFPDTEHTFTTGLYLDSEGEIKELSGKSYIELDLNRICGATASQWLQFNVDIVHFSKYYYVYKASNINIPALRPLIRTDEELAKYGMAVTASGQPYLQTLATLFWANDGQGHDGRTTLREFQFTDSLNGYNYADENAIVDWSDDFYTENHDDEGHEKGYSMFKTSIRQSTYRMIDVSVDEWPKYLPKGFTLWTFDGGDYMFNPNNENSGSSYNDKSLPYPFLKYYNQSVVTTYRFYNSYNDNKSRQIASLWYYDDDEGNLRMFNTFFFLDKIPGSHILKLTISYKSEYTSTYPATIGLALASLLANIYAYSGNDVTNNHYIADCVYLSDNTTSFTLDIVYDAEVTIAEPNNIMLFNGVEYPAYLTQVLEKAEAEGKINKDNVNIVMRKCIKNCPLQMNMLYREPNLEAINQEGTTTAIIDIENKTNYIYNWKPSDDTLYQLEYDSEGTIQAIPLNSNFTVKYLTELKADSQGILTGKFGPNQEVYSDFCKVFNKYDDGLMKFKTSKAYGSSSKYFSINSLSWSENYAIRDIPKSDVIFPFAKVLL